MRKIASYILILIFLTAYGRCVADQLGILHTSGVSCCQTTCDDALDDCLQCPDTSGTPPWETNQPDNSQDRDTPLPCQLCFILVNDSMLTEDGIRIPSPAIQELTDFITPATPAPPTARAYRCTSDQRLIPGGHPGPPLEQRYLLLRTRTVTTPVRGPSPV